MRVEKHGLAFALAVALGCALAPSAAQASTGTGVIEIDGPDLSRLPIFTLGIGTLAFGMVDAFYATQQRPMPVALSIVQIAVAGFLLPTFMLTSHGFRELEGGERVALGVYGCVNLAWFSGHGFQQLLARRALSRRTNPELGGAS